MPARAQQDLTAGLGLKPEHFEDALASREPGLWFEVHAENYMAPGGPRLGWLQRIRERHPLSIHGVGLSLGADRAPDAAHLHRLAALVRRFEPALVSEHLAWSSWRDVAVPDLLPVPRTREALDRVADNVARVQDALGGEVAVENPAHYVSLPGQDYDEPQFLGELVRRTGCGLLLDVNNVYVSANNLGADARSWLLAILAVVQAERIVEIHLAGHARNPALAESLLLDSHDTPVAEPVWDLYALAIARLGPRPTLIERDGNIPAYVELMQERNRAQAVLVPALAETPA